MSRWRERDWRQTLSNWSRTIRCESTTIRMTKPLDNHPKSFQVQSVWKLPSHVSYQYVRGWRTEVRVHALSGLSTFPQHNVNFIFFSQNIVANVHLCFLFVTVAPLDLCVICQLPGCALRQETHLFQSLHGNFFKGWQNDLGAKINWRINVWQ